MGRLGISQFGTPGCNCVKDKQLKPLCFSRLFKPYIKSASPVKLDDTTEAYGWINSGQSIGYGAGAAVAGIVVDKLTSTTSFALASGLDFLALVVALSAVAITPAFLNSESKKEDSK